MHPALSVILFTTLSGAGYGLAFVLGLGLFDPASVGAAAGYMLAIGLIGFGLLMSTLHLGNPQRFLFAFTQWRTSWLSREGVLAIVAFAPLGLAALLCVFRGQGHWLLGLAISLLAIATVYCTAMIYASLKSVPLWHQRLTPVVFLTFSLTSGLVLASALDSLFGGARLLLVLPALLSVLVAVAVKFAWLGQLQHQAKGSTPETATGLGHIGKVRSLERPHSTDNYLTREMGFRVARKHVGKLRMIAFVAGALVPGLALLLALIAGSATVSNTALALAAFLHLFGVMVERWLFFAEARHVVSNYYGL